MRLDETGGPEVMIENLKAYPKYKDSGVPWLGKVPEHWDIRRIKYAHSPLASATPEGDKV